MSSEVYQLETSVGTISGKVVVANGKRVVKFLGIPYAQQPVGSLRFKPLQPLALPIGTKDSPYEAFKVGPSSIQNVDIAYGSELPIGEDCIYLNIFMPVEKSDSPRHVFFHIHGGGFVNGSGSEPMYDLTYFAATHDAVALSINYRLNHLGFLSLPPVIEDNLGLKDQQTALRWVHDHISSFGGDPEKVTIYGCSAGGASCHFHLMNEKSQSLFSRAIVSSGCANYYWSMVTPAEQGVRVQTILSKLRCPPELSKEEILEFLQKVEIQKFINLMTSFKDFATLARPVNTFCANPDSRKPLGMKPMLFGTTALEGNIFPDQFYPAKQRPSELTWARKTAAVSMGEQLIYQPFRSLREEIASIPKYPLFCYLFDFDSQSRNDTCYPEWFCGMQHGNAHTTDIPFFFSQNCPGSFLMPNTSQSDHIVNKAMAEMVEKFMKNDVNEMGLPVFTSDKPVVTTITREGLSHDENVTFNLFENEKRSEYVLALKLLDEQPDSN